MLYTVYKTTNLVNSRFYYGHHRTLDLNDSYLGSGVLLRRAIRKYSRDNFLKTTVAICTSEEAMFFVEKRLVALYLGNPLCYNLAPGGPGGTLTQRKAAKKASTGRVKSASEIEKIRVAAKNKKLSLIHREKMREARIGKPLSEEWRSKIKQGMACKKLRELPLSTLVAACLWLCDQI